MTYDDILSEIFSSYMAVKPRLKGRPDRETRNPQIILGVARSLNLLPDPSKIIRITGSKGKGTVTRCIERILRKSSPAVLTGMLISPEELEHYDRVRINGGAVSQAEFVEAYLSVRTSLLQQLSNQQTGAYLSPSGQFLLIALAIFARRGVTHYVLETGRGVKYDEVGQIPGEISVVTSILLEHAEYLGPTLEEIARDKLSITSNSKHVILGQTAEFLRAKFAIALDSAIVCKDLHRSVSRLPDWCDYDWQLASCAYKAFSGRSCFPSNIEDTFCSASFGAFQFGGVDIIYDGVISADSLDPRFIDYLQTNYGNSLKIIASLPDDKDVEAICSFFSQRSLPPEHIVLAGTRGYLCYEDVSRRFAETLLGTVDYDDPRGFLELLKDVVANYAVRAIYLIGTQSFLRLLKKAMAMR